MAVQPLWFVGNRSPSITDQITTSDGTPVDLTSATVTFSMRLIGSATLKVSAATAVIVAPATNGNVRYDWQTADVNAAGQYLVWWTVTAGGKTQDMAEALIEFRAHSNATNYIELEELKSSAELKGTSFADQDLLRAIGSASRGFDNATGRRFWLDTGSANVRYYTPDMARLLPIDDLVTLTTLKIDRTGDGVYEETWTNGTDFVLEPFNAPVDVPARPYEQIRVRQLSGRYFPCYYEKSVEVTGQFGWLTVPEDVKAAVSMIAARTAKRIREAPFGVAGIGIDGIAVRIARTDPDVAEVVNAYDRHVPFV
jgi:hypothetical protein